MSPTRRTSPAAWAGRDGPWVLSLVDATTFAVSCDFRLQASGDCLPEARLGLAAYHLGHPCPGPAAAGVALEAVHGREEFSHVGCQRAMASFQHSHHGLDLS